MSILCPTHRHYISFLPHPTLIYQYMIPCSTMQSFNRTSSSKVACFTTIVTFQCTLFLLCLTSGGLLCLKSALLPHFSLVVPVILGQMSISVTAETLPRTRGICCPHSSLTGNKLLWSLLVLLMLALCQCIIICKLCGLFTSVRIPHPHPDHHV